MRYGILARNTDSSSFRDCYVQKLKVFFVSKSHVFVFLIQLTFQALVLHVPWVRLMVLI